MKLDLHALLRLHADAAPRPWAWSPHLPREVFIPAGDGGVGREAVFYRTKHAALCADAVNAIPALVRIAMAAENLVRCMDGGETMTGAMNRLRAAVEDDDG